MAYQALYRTWRPQTFSDLVGQPHVRQTLVNAVTSGQVAHAYLFCGPRGTGKTSAAKILAKAVNCTDPKDAEPCNACDACRSIAQGTNVDVEEIDAASNRGVDEIRQLRDKVQYAPASLQKKVYIVDEVHMLTPEAFNALLKTLEEPPSHTLFVLATTEPHKIPATIISRCQRFDFRRISEEEMVARLEKVCAQEGWRWEPEALWRIADLSDGGLRDALGLLEQVASFGQGEVSSEHTAKVAGGVQITELLSLVDALFTGKPDVAMSLLLAWYASGKEAGRIVHDVLQVLRDLFVVKVTQSQSGSFRSADFQTAAQRCDVDWLLAAVKHLGETYVNLRHVDQPRLALEASMLALVSAGRVDQGVSATPAAMTEGMKAVRTHETAIQPKPQPEVSVSELGAASTRGTEPVAASRSAKARTNGSEKNSRKMEVLRQLVRASDEQVLNRIQERWEDFLAAVKAIRVKTYAWLVYGHAVLATADTLVLSFQGRMNRDAVMKPDERSVIEEALSEIMEKRMQILALLQSDWVLFHERAEEDVTHNGTRGAETSSEANEWVNRVSRVFGEARVEIIDEE